MKKLNELMKEMGFNPNASDSVKEAFLKHLIKNSTGADVMTPSEKKIVTANPLKIVNFPKQLSFEFDETASPSVKKVK